MSVGVSQGRVGGFSTCPARFMALDSTIASFTSRVKYSFPGCGYVGRDFGVSCTLSVTEGAQSNAAIPSYDTEWGRGTPLLEITGER